MSPPRLIFIPPPIPKPSLENPGMREPSMGSDEPNGDIAVGFDGDDEDEGLVNADNLFGGKNGEA